MFAVQLVADAQEQLGQTVQHVELGDAQAGQAIDLGTTLEQGGIKPAATA